MVLEMTGEWQMLMRTGNTAWNRALQRGRALVRAGKEKLPLTYGPVWAWACVEARKHFSMSCTTRKQVSAGYSTNALLLIRSQNLYQHPVKHSGQIPIREGDQKMKQNYLTSIPGHSEKTHSGIQNPECGCLLLQNPQHPPTTFLDETHESTVLQSCLPGLVPHSLHLMYVNLKLSNDPRFTWLYCMVLVACQGAWPSSCAEGETFWRSRSFHFQKIPCLCYSSQQSYFMYSLPITKWLISLHRVPQTLGSY